jgi:hypothetical protein
MVDRGLVGREDEENDGGEKKVHAFTVGTIAICGVV